MLNISQVLRSLSHKSIFLFPFVRLIAVSFFLPFLSYTYKLVLGFPCISVQFRINALDLRETPSRLGLHNNALDLRETPSRLGLHNNALSLPVSPLLDLDPA